MSLWNCEQIKCYQVLMSNLGLPNLFLSFEKLFEKTIFKGKRNYFKFLSLFLWIFRGKVMENEKWIAN